jgi:bacterioferritin-associated ferredoxin
LAGLDSAGFESKYQIQKQMIVCICRRVSENTVRACIADGAQSVAEVGRACRAGTGCGGCHEYIQELIAEQQPDCPRVRLKVVSPYLQTALAGENA